MPNVRWTTQLIKEGVERYLSENGRLPTATDFDDTVYLPTARQVQRLHGGMASLRERLGYGNIDYTKGAARTAISTQSSIDGIAAEEYLEPFLIERFGEAYVHTQKRYTTGGKNRFDFFVYASGQCFGVDVFTTHHHKYIRANVRHKLTKYKNIPSDVMIYFVALGGDYTSEDMASATNSIGSLNTTTNIRLVNESQFLQIIQEVTPLITPNDFTGILNETK